MYDSLLHLDDCDLSRLRYGTCAAMPGCLENRHPPCDHCRGPLPFQVVNGPKPDDTELQKQVPCWHTQWWKSCQLFALGLLDNNGYLNIFDIIWIYCKWWYFWSYMFIYTYEYMMCIIYIYTVIYIYIYIYMLFDLVFAGALALEHGLSRWQTKRLWKGPERLGIDRRCRLVCCLLSARMEKAGLPGNGSQHRCENWKLASGAASALDDTLVKRCQTAKSKYHKFCILINYN